MKILILLSLFSYALAEAPIGDSYASARDSIDIQKSLSYDYGVPEINSRSNPADLPPVYGPPSRSSSQGYESRSRSGSFQKSGLQSRTLSREYGAPATAARNSLSQEYGTPNARNSLFEVYGTPNTRNTPSQTYGTPNSRNTPSQVYGTPNFRNTPAQIYGAPNSRNAPSQTYGTPSSRNSLSTKYGVPNARDSLSHEYGTPNVREFLSQEYGLPSARASQEYVIPEFNNALSDSYSAPRNALSNSYGTPLQRSPSSAYNAPGYEPIPSEEYGVPSRSFSPSQSSYQSPSNSIPDDYSVPSGLGGKTFAQSRNAVSFRSKSLSTQYTAPNAKSSSFRSSYNPPQPSDSYGAPKSLSSEYAAPESRTGLKTNAYAENMNTARSSPSQSYGPPARSAMPSQQYGVPGAYNSLSNQGYGYARNALDELLNQEPASYDFGYKVNDYQSGSDFGHTETRQDNKAEGSYFVVLPDGTKQTVEYEADERGFKPKISVEPADAGYDDNAGDLARSGEGPY